MIFLQLFWEFLKTGLFAVGGGLATLPFLKAITHKYPWFTANDLMDMIAVSESTPGPMGVNSATYAGFHAAGLPGALTATFSLVLPSVIIIILVSRALDRFRSSSLVQNGFYGLRPASAGLIFGAMFTVFAGSLLHLDLWSGPESLLSVLNYRAILLFLVLSASYSSSKESRKALFLLTIPSADGKKRKKRTVYLYIAAGKCYNHAVYLRPKGGREFEKENSDGSSTRPSGILCAVFTVCSLRPVFFKAVWLHRHGHRHHSAHGRDPQRRGAAAAGV